MLPPACLVLRRGGGASAEGSTAERGGGHSSYSSPGLGTRGIGFALHRGCCCDGPACPSNDLVAALLTSSAGNLEGGMIRPGGTGSAGRWISSPYDEVDERVEVVWPKIPEPEPPSEDDTGELERVPPVVVVPLRARGPTEPEADADASALRAAATARMPAAELFDFTNFAGPLGIGGRISSPFCPTCLGWLRGPTSKVIRFLLRSSGRAGTGGASSALSAIAAAFSFSPPVESRFMSFHNLVPAPGEEGWSLGVRALMLALRGVWPSSEGPAHTCSG
jgi:hypothetical protein